ncbi:MAG: tetratricopeptide repeat-containing protein, partial [Deltaproteobacteria bacterium]|nr:tetratricopeptide repeat-containing protein [Deltaproteobacteria bacterium]
LGSAWKALGEYHKAIEYYEKAVHVRHLKLGKNHKKTLSTESLLSEARNALGKTQKTSFFKKLFRKKN